MTRTIVTGHGRSGTQWLTSVLSHFVDARHEPVDPQDGGDVIIDCRLRNSLDQLGAYRLLHLVRDGRDVIRSVDQFYAGRRSFEDMCAGWAEAVERCDGLDTIRFEDLTRPLGSSGGYRMAHWREWPKEWTDHFWMTCGKQMRRHGYGGMR